MTSYTSDELYHFVGRRAAHDHAANVEKVRQILRTRCISHWPHEPGWGKVTIAFDPSKTLESGELVVPNMVCFCDIPRESLQIHTQKYGYCGVSLTRAHLLKHQARPVMYFPYDPRDVAGLTGLVALRDIERVYRVIRNQTDGLAVASRRIGTAPKSAAEFLHAVDAMIGVALIAFIKAYDETLPESHPDNYYMEREWRRLGNMRFEPDDVGRVVVPTAFVPALQAEFPELADKFDGIDVSI